MTMWLGRFQVGDTLPLLFACGDPKIGTPFQPYSQVCASVYAESGVSPVFSMLLSPVDRFSNRWVFSGRLLLTGTTGLGQSGQYVVLFSTMGFEVCIAKWAKFEVFGGDQDGAVIAMQNTFLPESRKLIYETDSGNLKLGRNPS